MTDANRKPATPPLTAADGKTPLTPTQKPKSDIFHTLAGWLVYVVGIIPRILGGIMEHFSEPGSWGAITLGNLVFVFGVLLTADTYWQSLFQGVPLFPFFEETWAGWSWLPGFALFPLRGWVGIIFNPTFFFALAVSFVVQLIQSATIRNAAFSVKPVLGISPRTIGLLALGSWAFDLIQTFSSRNPLQFSDPGDIFKCLMYNLFSIVAAELGYIVYRMLKG